MYCPLKFNRRENRQLQTILQMANVKVKWGGCGMKLVLVEWVTPI